MNSRIYHQNFQPQRDQKVGAPKGWMRRQSLRAGNNPTAIALGVTLLLAVIWVCAKVLG